jgi:hypothetical protein
MIDDDLDMVSSVRTVMESAGWRNVEIHRLTFGTATVQTGIKG